VAGSEESPVYAILKMNKDLDNLKLPGGYTLMRHNAEMPESTDHYSMKWDGEWHITIEVFRDLGLAFAAVLILNLCSGGWVVSLIRRAPDYHGADPTHAGGDTSCTCSVGSLLHSHIDDRLHCWSRHYRTKLDHSC